MTIWKFILPDGHLEIKDYAFHNNISLQTMLLPEDIEKIGACKIGEMKKHIFG